MELLDLMKKISQNDIPNFLILFGEEQKILDIYIEHILSTTKGKRICKDSVSSVMQSTGKKSLDKSIKVYTVIDDMDFLTADKKWDSVKKLLKNQMRHCSLRIIYIMAKTICALEQALNNVKELVFLYIISSDG